jgi:hypothetical protein
LRDSTKKKKKKTRILIFSRTDVESVSHELGVELAHEGDENGIEVVRDGLLVASIAVRFVHVAIASTEGRVDIDKVGLLVPGPGVGGDGTLLGDGQGTILNKGTKE